MKWLIIGIALLLSNGAFVAITDGWRQAVSILGMILSALIIDEELENNPQP
jgi:hypothetical protein